MYDLNYDGYLCVSLNINKGAILKSKSFEMPDAIVKKYENLKKRRAPIKFSGSKLKNGQNQVQYKLCDSNDNGNIGWGECMSCLRKACFSSVECGGLCAVIDISSTLLPPKPGGQCTLSMGASCIYIAAAY